MKVSNAALILKFARHILNLYHHCYTLQKAFDWGEVDMTAFAKCLLAMCEQVKDLLRTESRLIRLRSPVYILG